MTRLMDSAAEFVCSVANARCPVSQVAHLAYQDHVGVLPQHILEGSGERAGVAAYLTLVHEAVLVAVHELDRVLHGDDVPGPLPVDLVDHGR